MATRLKKDSTQTHQTFEPGGMAWSFLAGVGSVIHLVPGVVNPIYDTAYYSAEWVTPESLDGVLIHNYWEWVGADLASAIEETAKVA